MSAVVKPFAPRAEPARSRQIWLGEFLKLHFPADYAEREFKILDTIDRYAKKGKNRAAIEQALKEVSEIPGLVPGAERILKNVLEAIRDVDKRRVSTLKAIEVAARRAEAWHRCRGWASLSPAVDPENDLPVRSARRLRKLHRDIVRESEELVGEMAVFVSAYSRGRRNPDKDRIGEAYRLLRKAGVSNLDDRQDLVGALIRPAWSIPE